jgi:hypothetical protein
MVWLMGFSSRSCHARLAFGTSTPFILAMGFLRPPQQQCVLFHGGLRHIRMMLQSRQRLRGPVLPVRIVASLGIPLEQPDGILVCGNLHIRILLGEICAAGALRLGVIFHHLSRKGVFASTAFLLGKFARLNFEHVANCSFLGEIARFGAIPNPESQDPTGDGGARIGSLGVAASRIGSTPSRPYLTSSYPASGRPNLSPAGTAEM